MKKLLLCCALLLLSFSTVRAQSLVNTTWAFYYPGNTLFQYFHFTADTLYFSPDNATYAAYSEVLFDADTMTIVDLQELPGGCLFTDTGSYTFEIDSDTLRFSPLSDPCSIRHDALDAGYGVQADVGIATMAPDTLVAVFPNPSQNGVFHVRMPAEAAVYNSLRLVSMDGRLIAQQNLSAGGPVDRDLLLEVPASGVCLLTLSGPGRTRTVKLVVQTP
jgi:hypothetical protein